MAVIVAGYAEVAFAEPVDPVDASITEAIDKSRLGEHAEAAEIYLETYGLLPMKDRGDDMGLLVVEDATKELRLAFDNDGSCSWLIKEQGLLIRFADDLGSGEVNRTSESLEWVGRKLGWEGRGRGAGGPQQKP